MKHLILFIIVGGASMKYALDAGSLVKYKLNIPED